MNTDIDQLQSVVLEKLPVLNDIYRVHGQKTVYDHVQDWQGGPAFIKPVLAAVITEVVGELYGEVVAQEINKQLSITSFVSTIDHHGLLNHPFFINSNLIVSLRKDMTHVVCFPTAGVSLNNSSWPGCVLYHENNDLKRVSFFSDKEKQSVVLSKRSFSRLQYEQVLGIISKQKPELLEYISASGIDRMFEPQYFWQQASIASPLLWQMVFPSAPRIVYPPLEIVMGRLLVRLLETKEKLFTQIIEDSFTRGLLQSCFFGMRGAFDGERGSFLFWGVDEQARRIALHLEDGFLLGGGMRVPMTAASIIEGIRSARLYPGSLLCFILLLWGGITALGGFNQVNWLMGIQEKFVLFLKELEHHKTAREVSLAVTNNFAEGSLGFLKKDILFRAAGADIWLEKESSLYQKYIDLSHRMTVAQCIELSLSGMYRVIVPDSERIEKFERIEEHMIARQNGVTELVREILTTI